eukprot:1159326-Pelagomonas_calceolata.AAC.4
MSKRMRVARSTRSMPQHGSRHKRTRHHGSSAWTREQSTHTTDARRTGTADPNLHTLFTSTKQELAVGEPSARAFKSKEFSHCVVFLPSSHWEMANFKQAWKFWEGTISWSILLQGRDWAFQLKGATEQPLAQTMLPSLKRVQHSVMYKVLEILAGRLQAFWRAGGMWAKAIK